MKHGRQDAMARKSDRKRIFPARGGKSAYREETMDSGRYIPYSGGSMGWFENSGVLKSELGNDYTFYTVLDSELVRIKQFERMSDRPERRRGHYRVPKALPVNLMVADQPGAPARPTAAVSVRWSGGLLNGHTKDISFFGMCLQFERDPRMPQGARVQVAVLQADGDALMTVNSEVAWVHKLHAQQPVWNMGIAFTGITGDIDAHLHELLD